MKKRVLDIVEFATIILDDTIARGDLKKAETKRKAAPASSVALRRFEAFKKSFGSTIKPVSSGGDRGVPVGTVHTYKDGQKYRKMAPGVWVPVKEGAGHGLMHPDQKKREKAHTELESHAQKVARINAELKKRQSDKNTVKDVKKQVLRHIRQTMGRVFDGPMPKGMKRDFDLRRNPPGLEPAKGVVQAYREKVKRGGPDEGRHIQLRANEIKAMLKSGKFALISAGANPNSPADRNLTAKEIKGRDALMKRELVKAGYAFTQVKGHYGGVEDSFLVAVHDAEKAEILALGKKFNQDSVIYSDGGKHELHYTTGPKAGQVVKGEGHEIGEKEDFFTEIKASDGDQIKFSLNLDFPKEESLAGDPSKLPADKGRPSNQMGPPPPENAIFQRAGKFLKAADVESFISEFEPDFKNLNTMGEALKASGASHFASRLKDMNSLHEKMNGRLKDRSLNSVTDVIGARALADSLQEQTKLIEHIKKNYDLVELEDSSRNARGDGYRAVHVLFRTPSGKIGELQIKTHRQQAFAGFTHDKIYKNPVLKNNAEVTKYTKSLSDYLHSLDNGAKDDAAKRPEEPEALKQAGHSFPWERLALMKSQLVKSAGVKYYMTVRDENKKTKSIHEFESFRQAKAARDKMRKEGHKGELPLGYAHSMEEFKKVFSEYAPEKVKGPTGPGSRGGVVIGKTKSGAVKYQKR